MKRVGNIWLSVISFENLYFAANNAFRGKRRSAEACTFMSNIDANLFQLQDELDSKAYKPREYKTFWINEPKRRLISAAAFRDRVVHHALINVIEPVFEPRFVYHSYACRKGKGNHRALNRFVKWGRTFKYVLKLDIEKFFPSIDHRLLCEKLERVIKDENVLGLCRQIIDMSNRQELVVQHFDGDDLLTFLSRRKGIPIGNLTSQFFGNVYLDTLDHFLTDKLCAGKYLRYVDDFAVFSDDKNHLRHVRQNIQHFLGGLRLKLNERKSRIRMLKEGVEFLGFVVQPDRIRVSKRNIRTIRRRCAAWRKGLQDNEISYSKVLDSYNSWCAHAAHGNTNRLQRKVLSAALSTR